MVTLTKYKINFISLKETKDIVPDTEEVKQDSEHEKSSEDEKVPNEDQESRVLYKVL